MPEYADGDNLDEVRAIDVDKDLNVPGLTMEMVVQHLVRMARRGDLWWIRYIIFNKRIWRANAGWATQEYNGSNPHDKHVHLNGQFNQASDTYATPNYHLEDLVALSTEDKNDITAIVNERVRAVIVGLWNEDDSPIVGKLRNRTWQYTDVGQPNAHSLLIASAGELRTGLRSLPLIQAKLDLILAAIPTDAEQDAQFAQLKADLEALFQEAEVQAEADRVALTTEVNEVASETVNLLVDPATPDEAVAATLRELLGERKDAIVALLQQP
jgi:hypothetical protein